MQAGQSPRCQLVHVQRLLVGGNLPSDRVTDLSLDEWLSGVDQPSNAADNRHYRE